jgi:hypothetical protein
MPYIQRRGSVIIGLFENLQPGMAEEWIDGNAAEVLEFLNRVNRRPDWDAFFTAKMPMLIEIMVAAEAVSPAAKQYVDFLKIEFSKRPQIDPSRLAVYWNAAISPVLTPAQIEELDLAANDCNLPVQVNAQGELIR